MAAILADNNLECIFFNENDRIPILISLKFVPRRPIDNNPALVQVMTWVVIRRQAITWTNVDLVHRFGTRGRWVKGNQVNSLMNALYAQLLF